MDLAVLSFQVPVKFGFDCPRRAKASKNERRCMGLLLLATRMVTNPEALPRFRTDFASYVDDGWIA